MIEPDFCQQPLKAGPTHDRLAALPEIVVDHDHL